MRQAAIFLTWSLAQACFVGGGAYFAATILSDISGLLTFGFCLFLIAEAWMVFIYVLAPLMIWAKQADDRAWLKRRGHPYN